MSLLSTPAGDFDYECASQDIQLKVSVSAYRRLLGPDLIAWQGQASPPVRPGRTSDNGRVRWVSVLSPIAARVAADPNPEVDVVAA